MNCKSFKSMALMVAMLMLSVNARADYGLLDGDTTPSKTYNKDCTVRLKSPSSAQGVVYVDMGSAYKNSWNPTSQSSPAATAELKANFSSSSAAYSCSLFAYPKPGYALDGFVLAADYQAGRRSAAYFLKDTNGKPYRSGDWVYFSKVDTLRDSRISPSKETYRFNSKETVECYAVFRKATNHTLNVRPGGMEQAVNGLPSHDIDDLIIRGELNADDFKALKKAVQDHNVTRLDLSNAKVVEIPDKAFNFCHSLHEVIYPKSGLMRIGSFAFQFCRNLKKTKIPASVSMQGTTPFADCISYELIIP